MVALTTYSYLSDGSDEVLVAAGGHNLQGWYISNSNAAIRYVKLYDKATAPAETDTPVMRFMIPAGGAANVMLAGDAGIRFTLGIGLRAVTGAADNNDTAVTTTDVMVNLWYR